MRGQKLKQVCVLLVLLTLASIETSAADKQTLFEPVHWAYSSFFGTGWYNVDDARSVFVVRTPIRKSLRKSSFTETGERITGIEIRYPLTFGMHQIEDLGGIIQDDNFATVSFTPGIELEIPVNQRWYLRTSAHVGWGTDLKNDESAWIYHAGIKSRYIFPAKKYHQWSLLNSLFYAGYSPDSGRPDHLAAAQLGVEFLQPLNKVAIHGEAVDLHWSMMYSFLGNEIHFNLPDGAFDPIGDQIEIGLQVSLRNRPFKIWGFEVQRLGVGYQFSPDGELTAITFSMGSWFTK